MAGLVTNRLSIVFLQKDEVAAEAFANSIANRYPGIGIEKLALANGGEFHSTGTAVAFLFNNDFAIHEEGERWLAEWPANRASIPVMPVALNGASQMPPAPLNGIKSRVWPDDRDEILTNIGASLGMAFRPGKQELFISYRQKDGTDIAQKVNDHFTHLGFNTFLDVADDRWGDPNLTIGDDVQEEIMERLANASAMIQIDTPSSPESPWVCAEVETAVGKRIPILPVVFHDDSVKTHPSRFRDLSYLHRRVCIQSQVLNGQFQILDDQLPILANELTDYLLKIYERRVIQPRLLENAFRSQNWNFSIFPTRRHLHKASRNVPANTPLNLLGCCSFEDFFFAPSCDAFLNDILDLSKEEGMAFSRSLYFYDGNVLYPQDLRSIMQREVTGLADANAELVHYNEAIARVIKISGGLNAIYV